MNNRRRMIAAVAAFVWHWIAGLAIAGPVDEFDDIAFWVGSGEKRAAIVIDWVGESGDDLSLVWGFRWDGEARGRHMLEAVVAADPRLYAKLADGHLSGAIIGLGYDRNDNGMFALHDGSFFDEAGIAEGPPEDDNASLEDGDWYREGWDERFWHYGISQGNPWIGGSWKEDLGGASSRLLADGDWDCWAFTPNDTYPDFTVIFAENSVAAAPPEGWADFDSNHAIDGGDLLAWQRGFGATGTAAPWEGDANSDGSVDAADLAIWLAAFGTTAAPASGPAMAIPEPGAAAMAVIAFITLVGHRRRQ